MKSGIDSIKAKANQIDLEELMQTGKTIFDEAHQWEFTDQIGPGYILDEIYTAYTDSNELVLEYFIKYCAEEPDSPTLSEEDYIRTRYLIYMQGKQREEISTVDGIKQEQQETYEKAMSVIERVSKREEMKKQRIRNFFRRLLNRPNNRLLNGNVTSLTIQELQSMLDSLQGKKGSTSFMKKYNQEKTDKDRAIDEMKAQNKTTGQETKEHGQTR